MLKQSQWGSSLEGVLRIRNGILPLKMHASDGTALPLVLDEDRKFGADLIRFAPHEGVRVHRHPGAHILFVLQGSGILTYEDEKHPLFEGLVYLVPSNVWHGIDAGTELVMLAVANDHRPADSVNRLEVRK